MFFDLLDAKLRLFGGEAPAGDAAETGEKAPGAGSSMGGTKSDPGNARRDDTGENMAEGAPRDAAADKSGEAPAADDPKDERRRAFRELINGEYKDLYTEETQRIINKRFRETAELRERLDAARPLLDALCEKYGVRDGDVKKLVEALEKDAPSPPDLRDARELDGIKRGLIAEARELCERFPSFDPGREFSDPAFRAMIGSGVPMESAFKALRFDELLSGAVRKTAEEVRAAVVANVRARGVRPQENGVGSRSAFTVKEDVSRLTREERAEIARRVARGETVRF